MNSRDIKILHDKISKLSNEEQIQRDLYLKGLANGTLCGPLTGYPSIDQTQIQNYDFEKYHTKVNKRNIYQALFEQNKDNLDSVAINYFLTDITYGEFIKEKIIPLIKAMSYYGVTNDSYIGVCLPGIPEAMASIYSLGYLGACGIYLPPYLDDQTFVNDLNKNKCKILFMLDTFYNANSEHFDQLVEKTSIEKIVIVPVLNSSKLHIFSSLFKPKYMNKKIQLYNEFIKDGVNDILPQMKGYENRKPVAVVYSSGSTGILKGVLLTHDTINNSATSYLSFGFDLSKGQRVYQIIPLWSSTGLIADGTSALYHRCTLYQNPKFDPIVFCKNLSKQKINWGIATTDLFNGIKHIDEQNKGKVFKYKLDYSKLKNVYIGGTLSTQNVRDKLDLALKRHGSEAKIRSSYGTCENGSIVSAELNGKVYPTNSVGVPIPGATIIIVDKSGNELPYGVRGEIAIRTESGSEGYYNRPDLEEKLEFIPNSHIYKFNHTGDVGYILPSGVLIYEGREKDKSVIDETELYNFDVKNVILSCHEIYDCEIIQKGCHLTAHIVLKDSNADYNQIIEDLQNSIYKKFNNINYVPELFKIWSNFPMSISTKRDFDAIKNDSRDFIVVPRPNELLNFARYKMKK